MKLLYFFDFMHFKATGKPALWLEYSAWKRGPVPSSVFHELSDMKPDMKSSITIIPGEKFQQIRARKKFDPYYFTPRQIKLLEKISYIFKDTKAEDMVETTHLNNEPWDKTIKRKGECQPIDYFLAIDGSSGCICEEDAREIMAEISEMHKIFGTI